MANNLEDRLSKDILTSRDKDAALQFVERKWGLAKERKRDRDNQIKSNITSLRKLEQVSHEIDQFTGERVLKKNKRNMFVSPILAVITQSNKSSRWIPEMSFTPYQRGGEGDDRFLAKNATNANNLLMKSGGFYQAAAKAEYDLFVGGRCFITKQWNTKPVTVGNSSFEKPTHIKFKHLKWDNVYWTRDQHNYFHVEDYSPDELMDEFGMDIFRKDLMLGSPFGKEGEKLNFYDKKQMKEKVGVMQFWNDVQKIYMVIIGSGKYVQTMLTGDLYPWTNGEGEGFIPINKFDAGISLDPDGDFPLSDIDKIVSIFESYSVFMNSAIERTKRHGAAPHMIGSSMDPKKARQLWMQHRADFASGYDTPFFLKQDATGGQIFSQTLDTPLDLNSPIAMRDALYDEIMIATGKNIRAMGQGAPTAEQERLRLQREEASLNEVIEINETEWDLFCKTNMYMLKGVESDFLDKHIDIEDEVSEAPETFGETDRGAIRDIVDQLEDFEFNVTVNVDNHDQRRRKLQQFEKEDALRLIAPLFPNSPGVAKLAVDLAKQIYPNITENDFLVPEQPQPQGSESTSPMASLLQGRGQPANQGLAGMGV